MKDEKSIRRRHRFARFRQTELGGLAGDSFYVAIWQAAVSIADVIQIALITRELGLHQYGRFALVVSFVVLVGQFFDVRVGGAATIFGARALGHNARRAAGVFQLSFAVDASTGVLGFLVVAGLAFAVGPGLVGAGGTAMIVLYALTLLVSTVNDSSLSILRLLSRFRLVATYTVGLEATRICLVAVALFEWHSLTAVLAALIVADATAAVVNLLVAKTCFSRSTGVSLFRPAWSAAAGDRGEFFRMTFHTSVVSYARLAQAQLPALMLGWFVGATQTGIYKLGLAVATAVGRVADPAYAALLPRISRLWLAGRTRDVSQLVRRATFVSLPIMVGLLTAAIVLRFPILRALGGGESAEAAGNVVIFGAAALALNGIVFWNIGLLYAAGRSASVSRLALLGAGLQLVLLPPLITTMQAEGAAIAFMVSVAATNVAATWLAVKTLGMPQSESLSPSPPAIAVEPGHPNNQP